MREILFRGQRIIDKKWVEGFLLQGINKGVMLIQFWDDESGYCMEDIIPETVGQFTGLTDKNGVKIFEGDIDKTGEIIDSNSLALYVLIAISNDSDGIVAEYLNKLNEEIEIIGNVHENPELLK